LADDDITSEPLIPFNETIVVFARRQFIEGIKNVDDFAKSIITLVSGFFVAYFALLKLIGIGENVKLQHLINPNHAGIPPVLLIMGII
jgi:hypothetical protein